MRQKLSLVAVVAVCAMILLSSVDSFAQNNLRVEEDSTRIFFAQNSAQVSLIVTNPFERTAAKIRVELLSQTDEIKGFGELDAVLQNGANEIKLPFEISVSDAENLILWRLRYRVTAANGSTNGTLAVSQISPDVFEIRAVHSKFTKENQRYIVQTHATQPMNLRDVSGVQINGTITIEPKNDDEPTIIKATNTTDAEGYAALEFQLPLKFDSDDINLRIVGTKNGFAREAENDIEVFDSNFSAYMQTDKPIYQPNQLLRVRTMLMKTKRIVADSDLIFTIKDPDGAVLKKFTAKTSRFGIANIEWQIPENARLGDYQIVVESENGEDFSVDRKYFKISRYDLPNFAVNAKPDKSFYLPSQTSAEIEISGDYLFGKPLNSAKVRVVQDFEREWNFKEQKYETKEGKTVEGVLDANGKFTARFDLTDAHKDFDDSRYRKFKDVHFAAYVTDISTNRTEQKRFDLRLTKEPIHVYLIGETSNISRRLPPTLYISTFYADGKPASCDVAINQNKESNEYREPITGKILLKTRTNANGAAKIRLPLNSLKADDDELGFITTARDKKGLRGTNSDELNFDDVPAIRLETDKTIYRDGEPIKIKVVSSESGKTASLDVVSDYQIIATQRFELKNGRAEIKLPYKTSFRNTLTIAAYIEDKDERGDATIFIGKKSVIYPKKRGLQIEAKTSKDVFRPNEEANFSFLTTRADGKSSETALGVVVFDKAIEERARTDADSDSYSSRNIGFYDDLSDLLGFKRGFGGLTMYALENLDLTKDASPELNLSAEITLDSYYKPEIFRSRELKNQIEEIYLPRLKKQFENFNNALYKSFWETGETPFDDAGLRRALASKNIDFNNLRDAWETQFRAKFKVVKDNLKLEITSASADKKFDTNDDLTVFTKDFAYFQPLGVKISNAFNEYNGRTGNFITDYKTLRDEMKRQNVNLDDLRDAFGERYKFQFITEGFNYSLTIESGGENRRFDPDKNVYNTDDFTIWANKADYFAVTRLKLSNALSKYVAENQVFPNDENEMRDILQKIGFGSDVLTDIYKRPFYIVRRTATRYADKIQITIAPNDKTARQTDKKPVTQQTVTYVLRSAGANGTKGDNDDFELASFTGIVTEQTKDDPNAKNVKRINITTTNAGVIQGTVTDSYGAAIPYASVMVTWQTSPRNETKTLAVQTNENGFYSLENLPSSGLFTLTAEASGFKRLTIENVQISGSSAIELNIALEIGSTLDTVEITSGVDIVNTTDASLITTISPGQITELPKGANVLSLVKLNPGIAQNQQTETPRLREYFPETLVWQPELITDANGKALLKFKLADSLTTWKLAVIGSTVDGEIGVAEKEFQAFQPFFAELDPPKILTTGDKIALPVVLRNYLDTPQTVRATMTEASWFKLSGQSNQQVTVAPNASQNAIFDFEAVAAIKNGKQRVTAIAQDSSDAIEKPVTVHPNGREVSNSQTQIFADKSELNVNFPTETLPKTQRAELKIYPNLSSHIVESVEGILERPHGCGEQTISSTYPSLLLLKLDENGGETTFKTRAKRYLQQGYERLSGYKASGGGFTYWGSGEADLALSIYALRFLVDAKRFIDVDDDLINETRKWIIGQQQTDGSWKNKYDRISDANLTAYIARNLANAPKSDETNAAIIKALKDADEATVKTNDAYILANISLAYFDAGQTKKSFAINEKLRGLAKTEGDATFWDLQSNTAFYGWGLAGRTETTALVIQAFSREATFRNATKDAGDAPKNLQNDISQGLKFLLKQKDRYGVWYSTQATINVLDALITLLQMGKTTNAESNIEILVNGNKVKNFAMSRTDKLNNPLTLDLTEFLTGSDNRVEIVQNGSKSTVSAQIVQNYYVAWNGRENGFRSNDSNGLRFQVDYDKTTAKINQEITCRVQAVRVGFKGYGMILAEIGLPPGAEVSRESLKNALESNYNISSYEILPDKIVVYMWATAGGTKFDFKFKPRYNIEANSAPSTAYDYYNPESQAVIAPTMFLIR